MTQIQNTSQSIAATKYFRIASREHTLAPPVRHRPRHSRMSLTACQSTPAIEAAIHRPNGTLYQLQPSFHTQWTEPEPTARARRGGRRILLDNSRVYVRFLSFVSGRVHLGRLNTHYTILDIPLEPRETTNPRTLRLCEYRLRT